MGERDVNDFKKFYLCFYMPLFDSNSIWILSIFRFSRNNNDFTTDKNEVNPCSVYVIGLTDDISRQTLDDYFSKFGSIEHIIWDPYQRNLNHNKWAIVTFSTAESAQSVIYEENHVIENLRLSVHLSRKKKECVQVDCYFNVSINTFQC